MACSALKQLIADADWGELDYFILDTPPGTSDIHLTLLQTLAITGAVIVSTPQQVALADARKGIDMYQNDKVNVPMVRCIGLRSRNAGIVLLIGLVGGFAPISEALRASPYIFAAKPPPSFLIPHSNRALIHKYADRKSVV